MSACGDSGTPGQSLTFNTSAPDGQYDINKFKNADYLYESYFGEFNLAPAFKDHISGELQMIANGFAMAEAKGEDVQQKMRFADTTIREMFGTREMIQSFESAAIEESNRRQKMTENTSTNHSPSESGDHKAAPSAEDVPSDDDRPDVVDEGFEEYKKNQERIVGEYNLPYPLPNSVSKILDLEYTLQRMTIKNFIAQNCFGGHISRI
ncbi:MAG: hypothetical protein AAB317_01455 [Nitrospirota bacterium]